MGARLKGNIRSVRENLVHTISELSEQELRDIEKLLSKQRKNAVSSSKLKNQDSVESILTKLLDDPSCSILHLRLSKHIQENWDTIKSAQLLTRYIVKSLERFEKVEDQSIFHRRLTKGSEAGSFFENIVANVIKWYLSSQISLWNIEKKLGVEVLVNSPIIIPGNRNKKKADILITDLKFGKPLIIIELKKAFTKASLKKIFREESQEYAKLGPNLKYLFVIFNASKTKTKTYKQVSDCRVICNDYGMWERSIKPKIIDSIESILEELFNHLTTMEEKKKITATDHQERYWLCQENFKMKNGTIAFVEGKKYREIKQTADLLLLVNEQGNEHSITGYWESWLSPLY